MDSQSTVVRILVLQILIITTVTAGFALLSGLSEALWPLLGGFAAFIPNLYFALRIYSSKGKSARKIVNSFYAGESGKLVLTAILFFLIFQIPHVKILPLLSGYIAALSVFWFALIMR
jgi:ATP synthase protein I